MGGQERKYLIDNIFGPGGLVAPTFVSSDSSHAAAPLPPPQPAWATPTSLASTSTTAVRQRMKATRRPRRTHFPPLPSYHAGSDHPDPVPDWEKPPGACDSSPIGGATEEDYNCSLDMGLRQVRQEQEEEKEDCNCSLHMGCDKWGAAGGGD